MRNFQRIHIKRFVNVGCVVVTLLAISHAQQATPPQTDSSFIDEHGTAHITRVIPVPQTVSPEAQASLARVVSDAAIPETLAERRSKTDAWQTRAGKASEAVYPVKIESETIAGVPVRVVDPVDATPMHPDRVLINLHGGGFSSDSGSFTESIPIANLTHMRVIAVLYRLAPEHQFPAAVDDVVAIYRDVLKTYKPAHIGIYGTSAGAILTRRGCGPIQATGTAIAGRAGRLLRARRLLNSRRLAGDVFAERPLGSSRSAERQARRRVLRRD